MTAWVRHKPNEVLQAYQLGGTYQAAAQRFAEWVNAKGGMSDCSGEDGGPWFVTLRRGSVWVNVHEGDWVVFHPLVEPADVSDSCFELLSAVVFENLYEIETHSFTETREGLLIRSEVDAKIIRNILEALCEQQGISIERFEQPAPNFVLAHKLGIGRVFGMAEDQVRDDLGEK